MNTQPGLDPAALDLAAQRLTDGGLVAFATETVYGLGARADDDHAVAQIFAIKGRPSEHPLIVHVADAQAALRFAEPPSLAAQRLMAAHWPGPVSVVLRRRADIAGAASGGLPTVALRCPSHPVAQALLQRCLARGVPGLAAPSANRFGRVSPTRAEHVREEFGPELLVLDGGPCEAGIESAIVDCTAEPPRLLRPGSLTRDTLAEALGEALGHAGTGSPRVSGSLASHYAPQAQVVLVPSAELATRLQALQGLFGRDHVAVWARQALAADRVPAACYCPMPDNAADAARQLFHTLRQWDGRGLRVICVETPPADTAWDGVRDRLQRASAPR